MRALCTCKERVKGALRVACMPNSALCAFSALNGYEMSRIMDESKIIERRVQVRGNSFVLTIPQDIVKKMKIRAGQSVRFLIKDGEIILRPTGIGGAGAQDVQDADVQDADAYEKAVADMMGKHAGGAKNAGGSVGRGKLDKLRLK